MPVQSTDVAILGVDVGGTFTDAVLVEEGRIRTAKVPTVARQEESVLAAARAVMAGRGVGEAASARPEDPAAFGGRRAGTGLTRFAHGTTVATNALLERRGARIAYVGNAGFEHLLHLRRQTRAHLYRLCAEHPEPLVPLERCHGVRGRLGSEGELEPLDLGSLPDIGDAEAVAVCLLFAFRDPAHERAVAAELGRRNPGVHVVASHEVAPEFREYERASTTAADAYLAPIAARYLRALTGAAADAGLPEPVVMLSSGGVLAAGEAAAHPARLLVSGPAGGVVGAGLVARRAGFEHAIAFDMGGTSTDVCLLPGGRAMRVPEREVGGVPVRLPTVDVHTVGAGGGSLVRRDAGGALRVGPESAGADPGPACYGRGGGATVTDANLLLGRLPEELPGGLVLDRPAAERALAGIDPAAVVEVVNAEMLRALRVVSVERGHDPREFALVAYGGAGPLHACALAEELGIEAVLVPAAAGVLSALGLAAGDERRDHVVSHVRPLGEVGDLPPGGEANLRYRGQSFELTVPLGDELADRFHRAHEERYGYADRDREVELVAVRTAEVVPGPKLELEPSSGEPERVSGPSLVELDGSTLWIPPGWEGARDGFSWVVTRE
jgi:N-methylhydantoinase A